MTLKSLLFVPGDRPERFPKAVASGADAVILDLEDSVAPERKPAAREAIASWLAERGDTFCFVRVNPLDGPDNAADLAAVLAARPDGIMLPKSDGAASIDRLLDMAGSDCPPILPIACETAASVFGLSSYRASASLLAGITWGAEDLPASIGAATARNPDGSYTAPYEMTRAMTLFAAHAAGVPAIDTVYPDIADSDGFATYVARARRDGFSGMMAIHPAQVPVINAGFTPSEEEVAHARAVVRAFADNPGAGTLKLEGRMIDRPHLVLAKRLLANIA